jgi:hypothetical protein
MYLLIILFGLLFLPASQSAADPANIPVPILQEVGSKSWCSTPKDLGPVVDEETFKKTLAVECFSYLKQLHVDFSKQTLITYRVSGDCFVHGSIRITRNDAQKNYTLSVTKHYGGCRAVGTFAGWVLIEKLRPDYTLETVEHSVEGLGNP